MGDNKSMEKYLLVGSGQGFYDAIENSNLVSDSFYEMKGKDIKLSSEAMITNWSHNYHKLNHKEISNDDLPGDIVMRTRAQKFYKK